jgi:hypothetical protein
MAEFSMWWTTGGAGDGAATYTRSNHAMWSKVLASCNGMEGVAPNYLNKLVGAAGGANTVNIGTGGALVDGKVYNNSAPVTVNIPSAVGGGNTRIDRIVLRADWTAQTVRITRIAGTDAAVPVAPAITRSSGTTYDILLCQALVDTAGNVTVTDERTLAQVQNADIRQSAGMSVIGRSVPSAGPVADIVAGNNGYVLRRSIDGTGISFAPVITGSIADGAITTAKIGDSQVTTGKIADLAVTSAKLAADAVIAGKIAAGAVQAGDIATGGISAAAQFAAGVVNSAAIADLAVTTGKIADLAVTSAKLAADAVTPAKIANRTRTFFVPANTFGTGLSNFAQAGLILPNGNNTITVGFFAVPSDFVSGMTVSPIVNPEGTGNLAYELNIFYGAIGESGSTHSTMIALTTTACTDGLLKAVPAASLSSAALGDFARVMFRRLALEPSDTIEAAVNLYGYLVTYTADS